MAVPKVCGIETEFGVVLRGAADPNPVLASSILINAYVEQRKVGWDFEDESPGNDARGSAREGSMPPEVETHLVNTVLTNGARYYVDHAHPEYSTPECVDALELVVADKAGERILAQSMRASSRLLDPGQEIVVYKNNSDGKGNSYGTHENYLVDRALPFAHIVRVMLPWFVSRQVFTGAGKVGSENGAAAVDYQISQRADFFEEEVGLETTLKRPIVNTRDEPHADPREWQRLHVICGDANMMPSCTRRKVGLVRLVLDLVEQSLAPTWKLRDPVAQAKKISRSRDVDMSLELESGSWTTPAEIFESYLCAAQLESPSSGEGDLHCEAEKRGRGGDVEETPPPVQRSAERPPPRGRGIRKTLRMSETRGRSLCLCERYSSYRRIRPLSLGTRTNGAPIENSATTRW